MQQRKLNKSEWDSIEIPVSQQENDVLHLIIDGYKIEVDRILINKDYKRLITSGFLHVSWTHLIFNMLSLYAFSGLLENQIGGLNFLIIYFIFEQKKNSIKNKANHFYHNHHFGSLDHRHPASPLYPHPRYASL